MPHFQQHPDGLIFIYTESGVYQETIANFEIDIGEACPSLPEGFIGRYYEPGISHYLTTGDTAVPQLLQWPEGDGYIASYETLMAAKAAREAVDKGGKAIETNTL